MKTVRVSDAEALLLSDLVRDFRDGVRTGTIASDEWTRDAADMEQLEDLAERFEDRTDLEDF